MKWSERVVHLYCFSPAGVSADAFLPWQTMMPAGVRVFGLDRPGRFARHAGAALITSHALLADMLADDIVAHAAYEEGKPPCVEYACLGIGEGAALALSVAARVEHRTGISAVQCLVGYGLAPHVRRAPISRLAGQERLDAIVAGSAVFGACPELWDAQSCSPWILQADMVADEGAGIDAHVTIDAPLVVLGDRWLSRDWVSYSTLGVRSGGSCPSGGGVGGWMARLGADAASVLQERGGPNGRALFDAQSAERVAP